jgi:hypothetical protein
MRIAFDLDDTLIPSCPGDFAVERPRSWLGRLLAVEWLRYGTTGLLGALTRAGCDLWVYTTSLRTPAYICRLFRWYGVRLGGAVNQDAHWKWLKGQCEIAACAKYPPAFGIDMLVDDLEGVALEGRQLGYKVVQVSPSDPDWAYTVVHEVNRYFATSIALPPRRTS